MNSEKSVFICLAWAVLIAFLSACAKLESTSYACTLKLPNVELTKIAKEACEGSNSAYLELAGAYESGNLVPRDEQLAVALYRAISTPFSTPKNIYIYVPPAGKVAGYTMPIQTGVRTIPGNAEAQYRLALMLAEGRGQSPDPSQPYLYLKMAAAQGHGQAKRRLRDHTIED